MRCPECGGSLARNAFARATAKGLARSHNARLALWISPGVAIFAAFPAFFLRRAFYDVFAAMLFCLWAGGAIAVYYAVKEPSKRSLRRAILVGLLVAIVYLVAILVIALIAVLIMGFAQWR